MPQALSLAGTKVAAGATAERFLRHTATRCVTAALVIVPAVAAFLLPWGWFSATVSAGMALGYGVLLLFVRDVFATDRPVPDEESDREALSHDIAFRLPHFPSVDVEGLLKGALHSQRGAFFLSETGLEQKEVEKHLLEDLAKAPVDANAFLRAARHALPSLFRSRISASVVLYTAFALGLGAELLKRENIAQEDLADIVRAGVLAQEIAQRDKVLSLQWVLRHTGGIGRSWVHGYTGALDSLTEDLSVTLDWKRESVIALHGEERDRALGALSVANHHNVLLLGEPGTGRKTLACHIARALRDMQRKEGRAESRIVLLRIEQMLSSVGSPDQFLLGAIEAARRAGTFVMVCNDLPLLFSSASAELLPVLMRLLQEPSVHLLAVADTVGYHKLRENHPGVAALFEEIEITEPARTEVRDVLLERSIELARCHNMRITYRAVMAVLTYSERFLGDVRMPGKAVSILEDTVALALRSKERTLREEHIREVISARAHVDVSAVGEDERQRLQTLQDRLSARIIGQPEAVESIATALKRSRLDIGERKKPVGTFLLLGPTGVGKTYTAQVLAEEYFGTKECFIRVDLNEYATEASAETLLSSAEESPLLRQIHDYPSSLILLDEIEKAHPKVLHLFLQILDEGRLTDKRGQTVDFRNALILATSNAGASFVREAVTSSAFDRTAFGKNLTAHLLDTKIFSPEFINRFDSVIAFLPLSAADARTILCQHIDAIAEKLSQQRGIVLQVEEACIAELLARGVDAEFGARELRRLLADTVEARIADLLLSKEWQRGETMTVALADLHF